MRGRHLISVSVSFMTNPLHVLPLPDAEELRIMPRYPGSEAGQIESPQSMNVDNFNFSFWTGLVRINSWPTLC